MRYTLLEMIIAFMVVFLVLLACVRVAFAENPIPAKFPPQENLDQFQYQGQSLDKYNKFSAELRQTGIWQWRWEKNPQCSGDLKPLFLQALDDLRKNFPIQFIETPASPHFVRQSCGQELINKCGSELINCLPDSYPYSMNIYLASVSLTYQSITAISISLHEMFHAMCTWGEQYRRTSDGGFAASQDVTVMNVGPLSRHLITVEEINRWNRTCGTTELLEVGQGSFGLDYQYVFFCKGIPERATRVSVLYSDDGGATKYWSGHFAQPGVDANNCRGVQVWVIPGRLVYLKAENAVSWQTLKTEVVAGRY